MSKDTIDAQDLRDLILESVKGAMQEISAPLLAERTRIDDIEERLDKALLILVGNGSPEKGLATRFTLIERDVKRITSGLWSLGLIGAGLIVTAIWNIIAK